VAKHLPSITIPKPDGSPYLTRYFILGEERPGVNVFLHYFHSSDMDRSPENGSLLLHNHSWKHSLSLILFGGYSEERRIHPKDERPRIIRREFPAGSLNYINNKDVHRVDLLNEKKGGWSLFMTSARPHKNDRWYFWDRLTEEYTDAEVMLNRMGKKVFIP
jgi:hypothetical protein